MKMLMLSVFACLVAATASLPVYGTARYGRPPFPYRTAPAYYRQPYPYAQTYPEDLYYQPEPIIHYPYYPVTRPFTKSDVYQTLYPYYYNERLSPYDFYGNEDSFAPADEMPEHSDRGRTEALPVGQETWFEGESAPRWQNDYDDVNAAFLQNLIMYNDAVNQNEQTELSKEHDKQQDESDDYDDRRVAEYYGERDTRDYENEDVRQLKALAGKPLYHVSKTSGYSKTNNDNTYRPQQWRYETVTPATVRREEEHDHYDDDYPNDEAWINWASKRTDKSSKQKVLRSTLAPPTSTIATSTKSPMFMTVSGQKEEVLLRPATPVRHPFPEPILQMLAANSAQKKRTPSVYDTIKQLLSMEESYKSVSKFYTTMFYWENVEILWNCGYIR